MDGESVGSDARTRLEELAKRCLRGDTHLALKNISCHYLDGVLVLRGCVSTYYLKQLAQEAVGQLKDIERIDNRIEVVSSGRSWRR